VNADGVTVSLTRDDGLTRLRRDVGPVPWMVFEELLLNSVADEAGRRAACCSIRELAHSLGLAKDTVGRAIRHLRAGGLVVGVQARSANGAFQAGTYRIACVECVAVVSATSDAIRVHQAPPAVAVTQLSLLIES